MDEQRKIIRISISAHAELIFLLPEETFSARIVRCVATDISTTGVRLKTYQLGIDDYHLIIKGMRNAKISLDLPYLDSPFLIKASIVWVEFHEARAGEGAHCILGLKFERITPDHIARLEKVCRRLSSESVANLS